MAITSLLLSTWKRSNEGTVEGLWISERICCVSVYFSEKRVCSFPQGPLCFGNPQRNGRDSCTALSLRGRHSPALKYLTSDGGNITAVPGHIPFWGKRNIRNHLKALTHAKPRCTNWALGTGGRRSEGWVHEEDSRPHSRRPHLHPSSAALQT